MNEPEPKAILVNRPGTTDLAFIGWVLAVDASGWPEVRLYKSRTGKYIIDERGYDDNLGEELPAKVTIHADLDELVKYVHGTFGEYSDAAKKIFRQAASVEPKLLKYAIQEV